MNFLPRPVLLALALIVTVGIAWYFSSIVLYIIIAWILSMIGEPLMNLFGRFNYNRIRIPRFLASIFTILTFYLLFVVFIIVFVPLVLKEAQSFTKINIEDVTYNIEKPLERIDEVLLKYRIKDENSPSSIEHLEAEIREFLNLDNLNLLFNRLIEFVGNLFVALFSITFILFFFLKDRDMFFRMILTITPTDYEERMSNVLIKVKQLLVRYFVGIVVQITLVTTFISSGLYLIGIENALFIGFLAGIWNIVPYLGPVIGTTIGLVLGISSHFELTVQDGLWILIFQILSVFAIVQLMDNLLFYPVIFSNSVKAHPMEIFLILLIAASLAGIFGMIIAVPVYTVIRVVAKEFFSEFKLVKQITSHL